METNQRVLIVEDETDISELVSLHLKREGHEVTSVENGEDALKALDGHDYDLLVLDWMLPGLSGLELCKRVRANGTKSTSSCSDSHGHGPCPCFGYRSWA